MTVQIGKFQHPFAVIAANVEIELEDDAVLRERACDAFFRRARRLCRRRESIVDMSGAQWRCFLQP